VDDRSDSSIVSSFCVPTGPELVRSLMRELGLEPCQPRSWRVSLTEGDGQEHDIPDLVARDFTEPFSSCFGLVSLQNEDGLGDLPGAPGAAA
jgi:hypothetical protein